MVCSCCDFESAAERQFTPRKPRKSCSRTAADVSDPQPACFVTRLWTPA